MEGKKNIFIIGVCAVGFFWKIGIRIHEGVENKH